MKNIKIFLFIFVLIFSIGMFSKAFAIDDIATVNIQCNSGPDGYTKFADENETYSNLPAGSYNVAFGCLSSFNYNNTPLPSSVCTADGVGVEDPFPEAVKACFYKLNVINYTLSVTKTGTGSGTVTSDPTGISCGIDCEESYASNTYVELTATSASGSVFAGWSGACTNTVGKCAVTMDATKTANAIFTANPVLTVTKTDPSNSATITSTPAGGISCGADCSESYTLGTDVTINAPAVSGYSVSISNGCTATGAVGVGASCSVTMNTDKTIDVIYSLAGNAVLTVTKEGSGTVTSDPTGISCGIDCNQSYTTGTYVELTATPDSGSVFAGWVSDDCNNTIGKCAVTMDKSKTVKAIFKYTHTVTFDGNGATSGSTATQTFIEGETKALNANGYTRTDYIFAGWNTLANGTGTSYADQANYTMGTSNVILYAIWTSNIVMSGSLTTSNCTISAGNSSCTTSLSWTTTNPVATSAVTTPTNITVGSGNNSSATYTINYNSTRTFYLYNNGVLLDQETPTATCISGTAWDSVTSTCKSTSNMIGTITATNCTIPLNGTSCNIPITWSTTNPVGISQVTTPINVVVGNGNFGSATFSTGATGMRTFYLYNDTQELGTATAQAVCATGSTWASGSCVDTSSTVTLTMAKNTLSTGTGTVTDGIKSCGGTCTSVTSSYLSGSYVRISATPDTGSVFAGWSGWVSGGANPTSYLLLDRNRTIRALFNSTTPVSYNLSVIVSGNGTIISNPTGINCNISPTADCTESYSSGTSVVLFPTTTSTDTLTWSGDCNASGQVTMDANKTCTATFTPTTPTDDSVPTISSFIVTDRIIIGANATATWSSSLTNSCLIRNANTLVNVATGLPPSGTHILSPIEDTTYELVCVNDSGSSVSSDPDELVKVIDPDYIEN